MLRLLPVKKLSKQMTSWPREQPLAEVRAQKAGAAGDQDSFAKVHVRSFRGFCFRCRSLDRERRHVQRPTHRRRVDAMNGRVP